MEPRNDLQYCNSLFAYSRFPTRVVSLGDVPMGGDYPIRIQSMTNTNTLDTKATVDQCRRLADAGCEYIRITAPGLKEAENLRNIKESLRKDGISVPLIADVHFNPKVAEVAAQLVEKVRINPGNYADKKHFRKIDFTDAEYQQEIGQIRTKLEPLLKICREYGTVLRVGTNHGSLSDRIMSRYGDTPLGMAESALEFIRICRDLDFHDLVLSMKSSNVRVMVQATRLLVNRMMAEGVNYPLHLGVTEAGEGEDGRIKSAAGIGALLADGIGDTIRVSLTEPPEREIPVCKEILSHIETYGKQVRHKPPALYFTAPVDPFTYSRRESEEVAGTGGKQPVTAGPPVAAEEQISVIQADPGDPGTLKQIHYYKGLPAILVLASAWPSPIHETRRLVLEMMQERQKNPVAVKRVYPATEESALRIHAAIDFGSLLCDGLCDGIWLETVPAGDAEAAMTVCAGILQATGVRITRPEYVSCPTCGRTSYNILELLAQVKARTKHLKGLKIAVMGCIVNGPGEMADAHYGFVGSGKGKVTLYQGKTAVTRNIDENDAVEALVALLKESGNWLEPGDHVSR